MSGLPGQDWLIFEVGRRAAAIWWLGPALIVFCWLVVPIQRARVNVLDGEEEPSSGFWWAPGWGFLGLTGLGMALLASPILDVGLAATWAPFGWLGLTAELSGPIYGLLVILGGLVVIKSLLLYAHAWAMDRNLRYRSWRWHHTFRRR